MAGIMRSRALLTPILALAIAATPAEARRFRFGGFGGTGTTESIDRVADLPDRDPYLHDGQAWDLGWFHRGRKVLGVTTSDRDGQYVLYNGDRYVKLDATILDALKADLGYDPTATHRAQNATAIAQAEARKAADEASRADNIIPRQDGESVEAYHARARAEVASRSAPAGAQGDVAATRGSALGSGLLALILGIGLLVGVTRYLSRRQRAAVLARGAQGHADPAMPSFDERVAARLRALEGDDTHASPVPATPKQVPATAAPVAVTPGVRTFGRRTA